MEITMLENNWTRLLNKCMHVVTIYFFTFPPSKELQFFLKSKELGLLSYTKHYLSTKN